MSKNPLSSQDIIDTLRPELNELIAAIHVEPDERQAVAAAGMHLFAACQRMLDEHDLDWPPDATLTAVEVACARAGEIDFAAAVKTIRDFIVFERGERAKLN